MLNNCKYLIALSVIVLSQACGGGSSSTDSDTAHVELSWINPKTRSDGSYLLLSSIAGYRVYYGPDDKNLQPLLDIDGFYTDNYRVGVSTAGNYFFAITAYDTHGRESELSNIVLKQAY
ncbi:MAG: hypothetical protein KZQ86_16275 [Candidatus Thiodiazotropha sp. (ex Lucinoma kastoroae)]|nr:hypothetical protein [Candidatus Thiodiazotropha sp. (ex Lucinoma kastoroae)]